MNRQGAKGFPRVDIVAGARLSRSRDREMRHLEDFSDEKEVHVDEDNGDEVTGRGQSETHVMDTEDNAVVQVVSMEEGGNSVLANGGCEAGEGGWTPNN